MDNPLEPKISKPTTPNPDELFLAEVGVDPNTKVRKISKKQLIIAAVILLIVGVLVPPIGVVLIPCTIILAIAIFILSRAMRQKAALDQSLSKWAQQQGWKLVINQPLGNLEGRLFMQRPVVAQDLVVGYINNIEFKLFNFALTVTYQNDPIDYGFTVAKIDFPDIKARFVCQSRRALRDITAIQLKANDALKPLSLEGEFNNYFSLEAEAGKEVEVLEVFDPAFMDLLVRQLSMYSFEMTAHSFIMYLPRPARQYSLEEYQQFFGNFQQLVIKFLPVLTRVSPEA